MSTRLEQAIEIALELNPTEQAQLLEHVAANLASQVQKLASPPPLNHWGQNLVMLIESLDMSDWENVTEDPVDWLKAQRKEMNQHLDWDNET